MIGFDKMFNVYIRSLRQKLIPPRDLGKTTGVIVMLNNLSQPLARDAGGGVCGGHVHGSAGRAQRALGFFTDLIYLDLGGSKYRSRYFAIGEVGLPAGTTADLGLNLEGSIWTSAGEYRVVSNPVLTLDLLAGARMLRLRQTLSWNIAGDRGPVATAARVGSVEHSETLWDGIVGAKGRHALGSSGKRSLPFYVDVGTGESRLTWQAAGGISYAYAWGELSASGAISPTT